MSSYRLVALFVLVASAACLAQESRAVLLGKISDSTGAVIVGAKVVARNIETNVAVSSVTNQDGNYTIPYLLPGSYTISAEHQGFKKVIRDGIELRVNDRTEVDLNLEVGSIADSVTVTGETPLLETATASIGMLMDERRVSELPLVGGNAFGLARLAPGIATTAGHAANNPSDFGAATGLVVNGTRSNSTEVTLDGAPNMFENSAAYSPPQDLVQEFRIQTTTYDASLGHAAGASVNVSVKSGTNKLHGTTYLFDSWVRAVPWFSNRFIYDPTTGPITDEKKRNGNPGWLHQRWGDTATGPVVIPKLYNGRNKTFFSAGYEGLYIRRQATFTGTVPTEAQKNGDFSALLKLGTQYQLYDPYTTAAAPNGRFSRQPIQGNIIPASRLSPIAQKILSYYPAPNAPGTADGRQNFFRIQNEDKDFKSFLTRIDHTISEKHRIFARVNYNDYLVRLQQLPTIADGDITAQASWGGIIDDVYVFGPSTLLNLRLGVTYVNPVVSRYSQGFDLTSLGFSPSLVNEIVQRNGPSGLAFPLVQLDSSAYTDLGNGGGNGRTIAYETLNGTLTKLVGNHSIRFGGEFRLMRENGYSYSNVAPNIVSTNNWTKGPLDNSAGAPIGQGLASLLLGIPSGGSAAVNATRAQQSTFSGAFIQDDYRLTRKIMMNIGLRYEFETAPTERFNRSIRGFDFNAASPISASATAAYARSPIPEIPAGQLRTLGGLTFAGVNGQPRALWNADRNNFAPRIGLAITVDKNTVIRTGYGWFYDSLGVDQADVNQGGFNQATNIITSNDNGLTFNATLNNLFPQGIAVPPGASTGLSTFLGRGITFYNQNTRNPYMQRWSFSIQRQLPGRIVAEIGYVGNRGNKIGVSRAFDPVPRQYLSTLPSRDQPTIDFLTAQVNSPFFNLPDFAGTTLANQRVGRQQLLRPYPQFSSIAASLPIGTSWYHSLQVSIERRFANGVSFQTNYTWSKFMEATGFLNETDNDPSHVISDQDFPHRFTTSAIYELPFGRGKLVGRNVNRWTDLLIGGWQAQGFFEYQTGQALGLGNSIYYGGNLRDILIPSGEQRAERWFKTENFERVNTRTLANNIRTMPLRWSFLRGDVIDNFDLSFFKTFRIGERWKAQFRMESYNALNHVQFANPSVAPTNTAFGTVTGEKGHGQRQVTFAFKLLF
ncbi:MAG: carboxypeptidase-like regulatory domain-containing protein [Bryobacteraceae bacterium]|nr:carboxypeptidase-like regulatory domain-containing protein [Bryobacteraceae bacterium]